MIRAITDEILKAFEAMPVSKTSAAEFPDDAKVPVQIQVRLGDLRRLKQSFDHNGRDITA